MQMPFKSVHIFCITTLSNENTIKNSNTELITSRGKECDLSLHKAFTFIDIQID